MRAQSELAEAGAAAAAAVDAAGRRSREKGHSRIAVERVATVWGSIWNLNDAKEKAEKQQTKIKRKEIKNQTNSTVGCARHEDTLRAVSKNLNKYTEDT